MKEKELLEDRLLKLSSKADEIGAIAFCAANTSIVPKMYRTYIDNVLHGIESLCEQIADELETIAYMEELKGVSV